MITRKLSFVALLLILPVVVAEAQRGGSSTRKTRGFGAAGGSETDAIMQGLAESPSLSKDLQKANPVESLLGKKKDLQLSADEEKELKTLNASLKETVKPFIKSIDSVSKENKKTGEYAPTQGQMLIGRQLTRAYTDSVMASYESAADAAVEKLAADHRQPANDFLDKEAKDRQAEAASRQDKRRPPA
jgi:hypothetical protein